MPTMCQQVLFSCQASSLTVTVGYFELVSTSEKTLL